MKPLDSDKKVSKEVSAPAEATQTAPVVEKKIDFSNVQIEPLFQDQVDFDTFSKSDFRAVKILACEAVKKSKKLLKFTLNDGERTDREILSEVVRATDDANENSCLLTVCFPKKSAGDWSEKEYNVEKGTYVTVCCSMGCTLYADAALTQPIDDTVSIDTNGEEMTVYVVPDVPLN